MAKENPWKRINDDFAALCVKEEKKSCSTCIHKKDVLVPCEWLEKQTHIIINCPHYERRTDNAAK